MQSTIKCSMCSSSTSQYCTICKSITYCSETCKKADSSAHRLLCGTPVRSAPYTYEDGPTYVTVLFPEKQQAPEMVKFRESDHDGPYLSSYDKAVANGSYGEYHPASQILSCQRTVCPLFIRGNVLRSRPRTDHQIILFYDDKIPEERDILNRSIFNATNGRMMQNWHGPLLAVKVLILPSGSHQYSHMTMVDYRDVVDFLSTFPAIHISDMTIIPTAASPKAEFSAVRINCPGDQTLGRPKFEAIAIRTDDPACLAPVTSISRLIEFPIRVVRCAPPFPAEYGNGSYDICNPAATYLHMGVDPSMGWGFVGLDWLDPAGSVIVVREGGEMFDPQHVEALCHWCLFSLKPLFEDSLGRRGYLGEPLGKQEVLARVTRREFENFYAGFDEWKGSVDPAWKKANWPFS